MEENTSEESNTTSLFTDHHRRTTYTYDETHTLKLIQYLKFSSLAWLTFLLPASVAIIFALIVDRDITASCDIYLLVWIYIQLCIQLLSILSKSFTLIILYRLPIQLEPEDLE